MEGDDLVSVDIDVYLVEVFDRFLSQCYTDVVFEHFGGVWVWLRLGLSFFLESELFSHASLFDCFVKLDHIAELKEPMHSVDDHVEDQCTQRDCEKEPSLDNPSKLWQKQIGR